MSEEQDLITKLRHALERTLGWSWDYWGPSGDEEWANELEAYGRLLEDEAEPPPMS